MPLDTTQGVDDWVVPTTQKKPTKELDDWIVAAPQSSQTPLTDAIVEGYRRGRDAAEPVLTPYAQAALDAAEKQGGIKGAAATAGSALASGLSGALARGQGAVSALQAGTEQLGSDLLGPQFGRDLAAMPEAFAGMPGALRTPEAFPNVARPRVEPGFDAEPRGPTRLLTGPATGADDWVTPSGEPQRLLTGPSAPTTEGAPPEAAKAPEPAPEAEPTKPAPEPAAETKPPAPAPEPELTPESLAADRERFAQATPPAAQPTPETPAEAQPAAEAKPVSTAQPVEGYGGPWRPVMKGGEPAKNHLGDVVYENPNGARAIMEPGNVPWSERLTKEMSPASPERRNSRFLMPEEEAGRAAKPSPEPQSAQPGDTPPRVSIPSALDRPSPSAQGETPEAEPKVSKSEEQGKPEPRPEWTLLGQNADGVPVFTNAHGVHSTLQDGIRSVEPVRMRPTKSGMEVSVPAPEQKAPEYKVVTPEGKSDSEVSQRGLESESKTPAEQTDGNQAPSPETRPAPTAPTEKAPTEAEAKSAEPEVPTSLGVAEQTKTPREQYDDADKAHSDFVPTMEEARKAHMAGTMSDADYIAVHQQNEKLKADFDTAEKALLEAAGSRFPASLSKDDPLKVENMERLREKYGPDGLMARIVAQWLHERESMGPTEDRTIRGKSVQTAAELVYGGKLADNAFGRDRMYDAVETGVNLYISMQPERFAPTGDLARARDQAYELREIKSLLPTQTVRAGDKVSLQQFSTPPDYSFAVTWVANLKPDDVVIEPSAGTGGLAVHAMNAGVKEVIGNEISPQRRTMMETLPFSRITAENAEQLNNILPADIKPTAVIMNPPFSSAGERMAGKMVLETGAVHIEQALARLEPGGRLVAIVGDGMKPEGTPSKDGRRGGTGAAFRDWWKKIGDKYDVRANVGMSGKIYTKYGTSFPTRVLVIDKVPPTGREIVKGDVGSADELLDALSGVRDDRSSGQPLADQPVSPPVAQPSQGAGEPTGAIRPATGDVGAGDGQTGPATTTVTKPANTRGGQTGGIRSGGGGTRPGLSGDAAPVQQSKPLPEGTGGQSGEQPVQSEQPASGRPGGDTSHLRPDGSNLAVTPPAPELLETSIVVPEEQTGGELTESVYENYQPQRVSVQGAKPHPGPLVQSAAMASVTPPIVTYKTALPKKLIEEGAVSAAQLEAIIYAGAAHEQMLPKDANGVTKRRGFFIGDGTGVGKGREVAGIILDNRWQGRKKAVWVSEKMPLSNDAKRDWSGLGQNSNDILVHNKIKAGDKIAHDGILFTTYDTVKSGEKIPKVEDGQPQDKKEPKTRVQQIVDWLGKDFDGVIAFDESHNMGNAIATKGTRGTKEAAGKALAGLELQNALPNARVVYVSATGATEVNNLAYADRLGLWGPGTAFPTRHNFLGQVSGGGVAAMELVARDMKALGSYTARSLSYDGVEYDRVQHDLTDDQHQIYDKLADAWQLVLRNFNEALETTEATGKGGPKAAIMSAFWGGHQRFFNQLITSLQMPSVIKGVDEDLAAGRQAVLQLVNTNEAGQERALDKARASGAEDLEELDMSPKDQLMQLVDRAFPTRQFETYVDDNGNERVRPVEDSNGNPVHNKEALAAKAKLLLDLGSINVPNGPLEILINHYGPDAVSEVTGRKQRVVEKEDETGKIRAQVEKRGGAANVTEAEAFQSGKKKILVFSQAGGTGRSYHDDRAAIRADGEGGARRSHYLVQAGWRADTAVQGFGRTHRTNQNTAPIFHLVTTNLEGQKRFISSIARRLGQLGALTKGERRTGDQGMFGLQDNLESDEAKAGLVQLFRDIYAGDVEGFSTDDLKEKMGLNIVDETTGGLKVDLPPMTQFLNRVLSLRVDDQNRVFNEFATRFRDIVDRATENGTLDAGTETYKADKIVKVGDQVVYTDPNSGAETRHVHLVTHNRNYPTSYEEIASGKSARGGANEPLFFVKNDRSGNISGVFPTTFTKTEANGRITQHYRVATPLDWRYVPREEFDAAVGDTMTRISAGPEAKKLWDQRVAATPEFKQSDLHIITGAILPIWDRLMGHPKIFRLQTDEGERMLGRVVDNKVINQTLTRLGAESVKLNVTPAQVVSRVLDGETATLANGWTIKRVRVANEWRLELRGDNLWSATGELEAAGVFREKIQYNTRYFIPSGTNGAKVIEDITKRRPITALED